MRKARLRPRRRGASDPNPRWAGGRLTSTGAWDTPAPLPTDELLELQLAQHFLRGRGVGIERLPTPRHQYRRASAATARGSFQVSKSRNVSDPMTRRDRRES